MWSRLMQKSSDIDRGHSWLVLASACLLSGMIYGFQFIVGVYYEIWLREFDSTQLSTAWLTNIPMLILYLASPAFAVACRACRSTRVVTLTVFLFLPVSLLITSYVLDFGWLYASYGLLLGIGTCATLATNILVVKYFNKHMSIALALLTCSGYTTSLALAPLSSYLVKTMEWRGSFRVLAALYAVTCIPCIATFTDHQSDRQVKLPRQNFTILLKIKSFWIVMSSFAILSVEYTTLSTHLIAFARESIQESSIEDLRFLPVYSSIGNIFGRIVIGALIGRVRRKILVYEITLLITSASAMLGFFCTKYWRAVCFLAVYGFFEGGSKAQMSVVIVVTLGKNVFAEAFTLIMAFQTVFLVSGPMVVGRVVDLTSNYNAMLYLLVAVPFFAALILSALTLLRNKSNDVVVEDRRTQESNCEECVMTSVPA